MPVEEDAEIMTPYEDYSVEELKEAYYKLFYLSDLNDADMEEIDRILAVLREKDPLPPTRSVDEMWEEFRSVYMDDPADIGIRKESENEEVVAEKPEPVVVVDDAPAEKTAPPILHMPHRKLLRVALIAAVLVVILAAVTFAAAAMGYNLWGWLPVWSDEDIRFVAETPRETPNEYDSHKIPTVLASLGITEPLYPTWLPDDMARTEVQIVEEPLALHEIFRGDNRELSITISPTTGSEYTVYQKTENPPVEYLAGGVVHYIFANTDEITTVWYTEKYTTTIVGTISQEEMKKIIDSVYEVTK